MTDYLLFIDTEASGLPKKWHLPYATPGNWPHAVQISWLVYTRAGEKIKEANYFINNTDFIVSAKAFAVHGLSADYLKVNGIDRSQVLHQLTADLSFYQPTIIGHFTLFDYRIIGAEYHRVNQINLMEQLPTFCIMKATQHLQLNPNSKYLRLGDLYELLFKQSLSNQHNALVDATATANCYFELVKKNKLAAYAQPPIVFHLKQKIPAGLALGIALLLVLCSVLIMAFHHG